MRSSRAPQRASGTLNEGVTAVLVDVVVRDKRGQPVRDLTQADFEVSKTACRRRSDRSRRSFAAGPDGGAGELGSARLPAGTRRHGRAPLRLRRPTRSRR